jgi:hypothetical protein
VNAALLRALLTHAEDNPKLLDLTVYGQFRPSGIVADLAGRALLLDGWELTGDNTFRKDGREVSGWPAVETAAQAALGLTDDELWNGRDRDTLFGLTNPDEALARLRELTEQAEAVVANA